MENTVDNIKLVEDMHKKAMVGFDEWFNEFILVANPPVELRSLLTAMFKSAFFSGAQIGVKIAMDEFDRVRLEKMN